MLLVGLLAIVIPALLSGLPARSVDAGSLTRLGFRTLLLVAIPSWIVMRAGAAWIYSKEGFSGDNDPAWVGIGFITAEPGAALLVIATVLAYVGVRR